MRTRIQVFGAMILTLAARTKRCLTYREPPSLLVLLSALAPGIACMVSGCSQTPLPPPALAGRSFNGSLFVGTRGPESAQFHMMIVFLEGERKAQVLWYFMMTNDEAFDNDSVEWLRWTPIRTAVLPYEPEEKDGVVAGYHIFGKDDAPDVDVRLCPEDNAILETWLVVGGEMQHLELNEMRFLSAEMQQAALSKIGRLLND